MPQVIAHPSNSTHRTVSSALAALVALATRLGVDTSVEQLRRRFSLDTGEPTTGTLIAMARELGLEARVLRMTSRETTPHAE